MNRERGLGSRASERKRPSVTHELRVHLLAAIALCGLVHAATAADEARPKVVVRYFLGGSLGVVEQDVIDEFERRNPDIEVVAGLTVSRNMVSDPQRLLCAIAGGDPPDLVMFDRYAVAEWAARGAFVPLDERIARDRDLPDAIRAEDYFPATWQEAQWQGNVYAIPSGTDNRALYYNRDLLVAAGFVDDQGRARPPRTWDELEDYAVKLSDFERDDKGQVVAVRSRIGFIPNYGNAWFYFYSWMNGGQLLSDDGLTCTLASDANTEAMRYVTRLYDTLGGARLVAAYQSSFQGAELDPFLTGRVAMKIDGNWVLNNIGNYKRDLNFGVAPAPMPRKQLEAGKPYISWAGGWSWVIPVGAKHPEEAWRLIRWLASEEAAILLNDAAREMNQAQGKIFIPNLHANKRIAHTLYRRYLAEDPTMGRKFRDAYQVFMNLLPESRFRPVTPIGQFLWNQQVRAMEASIYHAPGMSHDAIAAHIKQVLSARAEEVQRELDRVYRIRTEPKVNWAIPLVAYIAALVATALVLWWRHRRLSASRGYFAIEHRAGVMFAMPWIIGFIVFTGGPIVFSLVISFCEYDVLSPGLWVGARNYQHLFRGDPVFWKSLGNTLFMLIGLPIGMTASLGLAMLLNAKVRGMSAWRTFFYLPAIMPAVASALLWVWIFQPTHGLLNRLFDSTGINWLLQQFVYCLDYLKIGHQIRVPLQWLNDEVTSKPALILMGLWGAGGGMIIWLAGLKGIPEHLYEAAEIDGASRWQKLRHITLPMLTPYIFFNLLMGMIGTFQQFQSAYIMTSGGPVDSTLFFGYHLFNNAFRYFRMGQASAMAWVLCLIVLLITIIQLRTAKIWVHYESE